MIGDSFSVSAHLIQNEFESWIGERKQDVQTLATLARIQSMNVEQANEAIQDYFNLWGIYETMFLADLNGDTIAINSGNAVNVKDRGYFQQAIQGEVAVSDLLISRASGNPIIVFAAPVYQGEAIVGVVGVTVPTTYLNELLKLGWFGETGDAYLVNQDGYLLSPPRFTEQLKQEGLIKERPELELQIDTYATQQARAGNAGWSEYQNYRGEEVLGAYIPLDSVPWTIIIEQNTTESFASLTRLRNFSLSMMIVATVVISILAYWIASSLSNPIRKMSQFAAAFALGDVSQTLVVRGKDEIGELADVFRTVADYQRNVAHVAERLAAKDLTVTIEPKSEKDVLGQSLVKMLNILRETLGAIANQANTLLSASDQLAASADQSGRATNQITATIQQVARGASQEAESINQTASSVEQMTRAINGVARGAQDQAQAVSKASQVVHEITSAIQQVAANAQKVSQDSTVAAKAAQDGRQTVEQTIHGMENIKNKVAFSAEKVQNMGERSNQIGAIVETIEDIASQTNLLALNAAIEAARAGEHGKGFAVVADEVRKLAERAAQATKEIGALIKDIRVTVAEAVNAMQDSSAEVEQEAARAGNAGFALQEIQKSVQSVVEQANQAAQAAQKMEIAANELVDAMDAVSAVVEENTAATEEMAASSTQVTQAIETIASVSEENSAAIEEVSASSEEMSAQVEEVNAAAQSLAEMARVLQQIVAEFRLNGDGASAASSNHRESVSPEIA
ncbi:MAG: hypothetical protein Kow0088_24740 [Anaerolineales bacterium]